MSRARPATRSFNAIRTAASRASPIAVDDRTDTPTGCHSRSRRGSFSSSANDRAGARRKSAKGSGDCIAISSFRRSAPCMRCSIATAWLSAGASDATRRRARRCPGRCCPMICGALITKANSCSPTSAIAIRSPSATSPAATSSPARPYPRRRRSTPSACSSACSKNSACPKPSAPTTACHSPARTRCTA